MAAIVPFGQPDIPMELCYTPLFHHHSLRLYNTKTLKLLTSSSEKSRFGKFTRRSPISFVLQLEKHNWHCTGENIVIPVIYFRLYRAIQYPTPWGARPVSFFGEGADPEAIYNLCLILKSTVGYSRTNVIGSRTSFVITSVRSSIHYTTCI